MRAQELIAHFLELIDKQQTADQGIEIVVPAQDPAGEASPLTKIAPAEPVSDDIRRFRQIVDLVDSGESTEYSNTPKEEYADISAVTTAAGGGMQTPKHPADIKGEHPSLYPGKVHGANNGS
jgi:hypothetical protein